jgi:hypothetical protein
MNNTLESSRFFPYIAWITIIAFAAFTYLLTIRLDEQLDSISSGVEGLEMRVEKLEKTQKAQ